MIPTISILTALITFLLAFMHIFWGHGGIWPSKSRKDLIKNVYGQGAEFPSLMACYIVAVLLFIAGIASLQAGNIIEVPLLLRFNNWIITGVGFVFGLRGFGGYLPIFEKRSTKKFNYYNKLFYSPLCILLSLLYILQLS